MAKEEAWGTPYTQVIIAALNEEEGIGLTVADFKSNAGNQHILVVDGRSTDRTVEIAKDMGAEILFQDGSGKGDALAKAITRLDFSVDYVVLTDADYTYPAEHVPEMIQITRRLPRRRHGLRKQVQWPRR